jgi:hypothetical protein
MRVPWLWTRRQIAQRWGCKPSDVDREPWYEVRIELQLMRIEHDAQAFRKRHHGRA